MANQTEKEDVENRDVCEIWCLLLVPLMNSILIDSQKQERYKSLENFRQMLENILSKLMVSEILAESLKHIDFEEIVTRDSPLKGLVGDSLVQRSASA